MNQKEKRKKNITKGFSLIELLIVVTIMIMVTSAVLFRQSKFSSDILITNMAYEVALSIREASVYGLSSKQDGSNERVGYGVHFESAAGASSPDSFTNFIDVSGVSIHDAVADDQNIFDYYFTSSDRVDKVVQMSQGQHISKYCGRVNSESSWNCFPDNTDQELNIVFVRPNPEAHITMGTHNSGDGEAYSEAKIVVESGLGDKCRTVSVSVSGQVSVDPINPEDTTGGCNGGIE
ncbi:MAG: type II secretion system protein [Patescibacteria group bacterium]